MESDASSRKEVLMYGRRHVMVSTTYNDQGDKSLA